MTNFDRYIKRFFDISLSAVLIMLLWWLIFLLWLLASATTKSNGFFTQLRVGKNCNLFKIIKIKTMHDNTSCNTVTISTDPNITWFGGFLRKYKLDELPQVFNVLIGDMSFVGPRPDVPGFADSLQGDDAIIYSIRPGITGPASIVFKNEEYVLSKVKDPFLYNKYYIWPKKVAINKKYVKNWTLFKDLGYLCRTIFD